MLLRRIFQRGQKNHRPVRRPRTFSPRLGEVHLEERLVLSATPYKIPLELVNIGTAKKPEYKLGIYVGLGGGPAKLYEFDTGGKGFWAAYSPTAGSKQWWGTTTVEETGTLSNTYSSGNSYTANLVSTTVSFYGADGHAPSSAPVVQTNPVDLAQITNYMNSKKPAEVKAWTRSLKNDRPPLFKHFYGDFGAALTPVASGNQSNIFSILPQIPVPEGLDVGFIVHVGALGSSTQPWLQIGIDPTDTGHYTQVQMNLNANPTSATPANFPVTNVPAYSEQVANAKFELHDKKKGLKQTFSQIGWTIDTGAPRATIWQAQSSQSPNAVIVKKAFLNKNNPSLIRDNVHLLVKAEPAVSGQANLVAELIVGNTPPKSKLGAGRHGSKGDTGANYVNTGIWTFTQYDVAFNLTQGKVGFKPVASSS